MQSKTDLSMPFSRSENRLTYPFLNPWLEFPDYRSGVKRLRLLNWC